MHMYRIVTARVNLQAYISPIAEMQLGLLRRNVS